MTADDVIHYGMHLKKSEPEMAEAIDIYKALSDDTYYGWRNRQLTLHKKKTNDYL